MSYKPIPAEDGVVLFRHPLWIAGRLLRVFSALHAAVAVMVVVAGFLVSGLVFLFVAFGAALLAVILWVCGERFMTDARLAVANEIARGISG